MRVIAWSAEGVRLALAPRGWLLENGPAPVDNPAVESERAGVL